MTTRTSAAAEGARLAARLRLEVAQEIRNARLGAGLSQQAAGAAARMSHAQFGRIERAELHDLSIDQASRAAFAVGLRLAVRAFPSGDPVRDRAQLALLERLRVRLPPTASWETEVPLPIQGDRRAWDAVVRVDGRRAGCEAETRLLDLQALERRLALKLRDGAVDVLILLVADTAANRSVLAAHRESLRSLLPLDGRDVWRAFSRGSLPDANALVVA